MQMSAMASMMHLPREGHVAVVLQIFPFLMSKKNGFAVFDPTEPDIDLTQFPTEHWHATTCCIFKEENPAKVPAPRGT